MRQAAVCFQESFSIRLIIMPEVGQTIVFCGLPPFRQADDTLRSSAPLTLRTLKRPCRMETLLREFRYSLRTLAKSRGFAAIAVLTLALPIGGSTAIFSVVDAVLLRVLPYTQPQETVRVWEQAPDGHRMNLADPNFDDFLAQNTTFANLAEYADWLSSVSGGSQPVRVNIAEVTGGFFAALGIQPFRGRAFAP